MLVSDCFSGHFQIHFYSFILSNFDLKLRNKINKILKLIVGVLFEFFLTIC